MVVLEGFAAKRMASGKVEMSRAEAMPRGPVVEELCTLFHHLDRRVRRERSRASTRARNGIGERSA